MVLLISEVAKIGATKPVFLDSGSPRGGGFMHVGKVCFEYIVYILKSNKNSIFFALNSDLCIAVLPKTGGHIYSFALYQIRALEKAFKKPYNGQS